MSKIFTLIVLVFTLMSVTACKDPLQTLSDVLSQNDAQPRSDSLNLNLPNVPDGIIGQTTQSYQNPIRYTAKRGKTYHCDKDGNLINTVAPDGYYRQILGVMDDGRVVAQDFYQNTKMPQTAIFIIKQGGDETNFEFTEIGSDTIWFNRQGQVSKYAPADQRWTVFIDGDHVVGYLDNRHEDPH